MNQQIVRSKIINLEAEIALLKKAIVGVPDFDIDEKNWEKMKPAIKKIRKKVYKKMYG